MPGEEACHFPNADPSTWMRSCEEEVVLPISGKISGKLPVWLRGTLLRNGPGSLKVGEHSFDHLFDSSALLHRFEIKEGNVTYQNRFVQTDTFKRNSQAKRIVLTEFGTKAVPDPCQSIFRRIAAVFSGEESMTDNSMISVYPFGDEFYTLTEAPFIHRIDPETLETKNKVRISDHVGVVNHTAHPHVMEDGTVFNVGMGITGRGPVYNVICFPPARVIRDETGKEKKLSMFDQGRIVATIHSRWSFNPSYMHAFGITDNYFVIVEQPLSIALLTLTACRLWNEPLSTCLKWYEDENTLIHVVSRTKGSTEKTFVASAFFFLHIINQFESKDGNHVVLDICCYRDAKILDCMYIDVMRNMHNNPDYARMFRGRPLRFVLPMGDARVEERSPTEIEVEILPEVGQPRTRAFDTCQEFEGFVKRVATGRRLPDGRVFVEPELLCDLGCETPRINYGIHLGKEYRYFYAISSDVDAENPGTLIKVDILTKSRKTWCEFNVFPSEPIFVKNPEGEEEDDGVVVSALVWGQGRETEVGMLVLDAKTFEELGRATFHTPGPVPKCLHGWFDTKREGIE